MNAKERAHDALNDVNFLLDAEPEPGTTFFIRDCESDPETTRGLEVVECDHRGMDHVRAHTWKWSEAELYLLGVRDGMLIQHDISQRKQRLDARRYEALVKFNKDKENSK